MHRHKLPILLFICASLPALPAQAESARSISLVLDASGSMKALLPDGARRMDAAKDAVAQFVTTLPPDTRLGFRAYGHQSATNKKDCKDTAQLAVFDAIANNKAAVIEKARGLQPQGYTPITHSLTLAAQDLLPEEAAAHVVVLVSDGKETCQADPCAAAKALAEADAKLVVHTVGVGVDTVTRSQLQCIARNARGNYYDANSASELTGVLSKAAVKDAESPVKKKQVVLTTPKHGKLRMKVLGGHHDHEIMDATGKKVDELSAVHTDAELAPGIYSVKFGNGVWTSIEVKAGETTEIKPGYLKIEPLSATAVEVLEPETSEKVDELYYSKSATTLIPGRFNLKFGNVMWPGDVEVKPGETTTIKPGTIGVESNAGALYFVVKDPQGQEVAKGASPGHRITMPPGKYVLELDTEKWIKTLTDAQRKVDIELSAGEEFELKIE